MKKFFSLVLVLALTLTLGIPALAADAEEDTTPQVTLTANAEKPLPGETVTLTLALTGALSDIRCFEYYIHYDPTVVELTESAVGTSNRSKTKIGTPPDANYDKSETDNAVTVSAVNLIGSAVLNMSAATVATLTFTVKEGAEVGASAGFRLEKVAVYDSTFTDDAVAVKTGTAPAVTVGTKILLGDVDGDGTVNHFDAAMVYGYYNGKTTFTEDQLAAADVNGDGVVNHFDAAMIYGFYNGKITKFPAEA